MVIIKEMWHIFFVVIWRLYLLDFSILELTLCNTNEIYLENLVSDYSNTRQHKQLMKNYFLHDGITEEFAFEFALL